MSFREMIYAALAFLGVLTPWYFNLQHLRGGGNLFADFFTQPFSAAITASVLVDLLIAFAAFNVWLFAEGRRLGLRSLWICFAVSWLVAFAAGFPLFLFFRERHLRLSHAG